MTIRTTKFGGTDWVDGEILDAADLNDTFGVGAGLYLQTSHTITGSAAQDYEFSGLTGDYTYVLIVDSNNNAVGASAYYIYLNQDTTATNYYSQIGVAATSNNALICSANAGTDIFAELKIRKSISDTASVIGQCATSGSSLDNYSTSVFKTTATTDITHIKISASQATGLGVGTKLLLYRY